MKHNYIPPVDLMKALSPIYAATAAGPEQVSLVKMLLLSPCPRVRSYAQHIAKALVGLDVLRVRSRTGHVCVYSWNPRYAPSIDLAARLGERAVEIAQEYRAGLREPERERKKPRGRYYIRRYTDEQLIRELSRRKYTITKHEA